ncbi:MAG TPA: hypothetical protein VMT03_04420 [Polyangia bacterium]|nr:hypothetical protein [Polyangia bacterium]
MADFRLVSTQVHLTYIDEEEAFVLAPGTTGDLALWGGGPNGEDLDVEVDNSQVVQITRVDPTSRGQNLRSVSLRAAGFGITTLSAFMPDGSSWATADVAVGFTPGTMIETHNVPMYGEIPFVVGAASMIPIPVPGTKGLCIQLVPRGWVPKNGTTSTLFVQDALGKRNLRLDYGFNVKTGTVNYHWNQKGTFQTFGIADHALAGNVGRVVYQSARYFRYAGRVLAVVGVAADVYSVVKSDRPLRQATKVISGWAGAWVGCKVVGAGGAWVGSAVTPGMGTAIGGVVGCLVGGFIGYEGAARAAGRLYDWADATFTAVPETSAP